MAESASAVVLATAFHATDATRVAAWKASLLRGYRKVLLEEGWHDEVHRIVADEVRELLDRPPPATTWVEAPLTMALLEAVFRLHGPSAVNRLAEAGVDSGFLRFIRPALKGMLRLAGGSPATLFSRMHLVLGSTARNYDFAYARTNDTHGVLTVTSHGLLECDSSVASWVGGLENVFSVAQHEGSAEALGFTTHPWGTIARYALQW